MHELDKAVVSKYCGQIAWPTTVLFFFVVSTYLILAILALYKVLPLLVVSIVNLFLLYAVFTPLHEAVHNNIRGYHKKAIWIENLIGFLSGTMLLAPLWSFKFIHLSHHAHTNQKGEDPDYWVRGTSLFTILLRCISVLPHHYYFLFTSKKNSAKRVYLASVLNMFFIVFMVLVMTVLWGFSFVFFVWLLPAFIANALLALVLDFIPHAPHLEQSRFKNTNIFNGRIFYYLSMGHSLHLIHHLWPRIPFYKYGQVYEEFKMRLQKQNIIVWPSLRQMMKKNIFGF